MGFAFLGELVSFVKELVCPKETHLILSYLRVEFQRVFTISYPTPQYSTDCRLSELESPSIALNKVMLFVKEAEVTRREFKLKASSTLKS